MFQWIEKTFRNIATTPIETKVGGYTYNGLVHRLYAIGGSMPRDDAERAEQARMNRWVAANMIGVPKEAWDAHNGIVPTPAPLDLIDPCAMSGHANFDTAPCPGTVWRHRRSGQVFVVDRKTERTSYTNVHLFGPLPKKTQLRIATYINAGKWDANYEQGYVCEEGGKLVFKPLKTDIRIVTVVNAPAVADVIARNTELVCRIMGKTDDKKGRPKKPVSLADAEGLRVAFKNLKRLKWPSSYVSATRPTFEQMQAFIDACGPANRELPPLVGERYISTTSGASHVVVDVRTKLYSTDYDVTMERETDKYRFKTWFHSHSQWLTYWRPLDGPDQRVIARPAVLGEGFSPPSPEECKARLNSGPTLSERTSDPAAELERIYEELDKRLPGWSATPYTGPSLRRHELAIRAIRALNKHASTYAAFALEATKQVEQLTEQNKEQLAIADVRNKEIAALKAEVAELKDSPGGWGAERVRREKDSMRELMRLYTKLFERHHGKRSVKEQLAALGASSFAALPPEAFMQFVVRCEEYSYRATNELKSHDREAYRESLISAVLIFKYGFGIEATQAAIRSNFYAPIPVSKLTEDELAHLVKQLREIASKSLP